jgi:hypothetical protein
VNFFQIFNVFLTLIHKAADFPPFSSFLRVVKGRDRVKIWSDPYRAERTLKGVEWRYRTYNPIFPARRSDLDDNKIGLLG